MEEVITHEPMIANEIQLEDAIMRLAKVSGQSPHYIRQAIREKLIHLHPVRGFDGKMWVELSRLMEAERNIPRAGGGES